VCVCICIEREREIINAKMLHTYIKDPVTHHRVGWNVEHQNNAACTKSVSLQYAETRRHAK